LKFLSDITLLPSKKIKKIVNKLSLYISLIIVCIIYSI
jgi:hypothetical protein